MKKIILILMIGISLISYSKLMDRDHLKRSFRNKFTDAKVVAYCENGKIMYKGSFKNGKKEGEWITYYKAEKIKLKGDYKNGKKEGVWISYYKDGKVKWKTNYKDGKNIENMASRFTH